MKGSAGKELLIVPEHLPFYLAFFEFVPNVRKRSKTLLPLLLQLLLLPTPTTSP